MLKQFYSSILSMTAFLFSVIVLCTLSFNWSNFKKIYYIDILVIRKKLGEIIGLK